MTILEHVVDKLILQGERGVAERRKTDQSVDSGRWTVASSNSGTTPLLHHSNTPFAPLSASPLSPSKNVEHLETVSRLIVGGEVQASQSLKEQDARTLPSGAAASRSALGSGPVLTGQTARPNPRLRRKHLKEPPYAVQNGITPDYQPYAIGAGPTGKPGVTPVEMAAYHRAAAGAHGRLVAAITDFVADAMSQHVGGLMRQGILPR